MATTAKLLEKVAGPTVADLLLCAPTGLVDRRREALIAEAPLGQPITVTGGVLEHRPPAGKAPHKVVIADGSAPLELIFFHARGQVLKDRLPQGRKVVVHGKIDLYRDRRQMTHPEAFGPAEEADDIITVQPVYPLTQGLTLRTYGKAVSAALERVPALPEWLDPAVLRREGWPGWADAIRHLHQPQGQADLEPGHPVRCRLAYDEMLSSQLALAAIRERTKRQGGRPLTGDGRLRAALLARLPFPLTGDQQRAVADILADMADATRMMRLIQGDVGSGKTVVALMAIANALEAGYQAAFMAPTEILARQHGHSLLGLLAACGCPGIVLTGRDKGKAREAALMGLAEGSLRVVIGTHALFQQSVQFRRLGLVIIDEQHRFGVDQRMALADKGEHADILVMTATPIPRTLTLTTFGDLDVSRIREKPPGRKPVQTTILSVDKMEALVARLRTRIAEGERAYWICPLVEESETSALTSVEERFQSLVGWFGDRLGLLHGRLSGEEKDQVMARFARGDLDVLIATTVIEVGVNVPEATVIVIEHAERFGLSQLHQLRGRVGRGDRPAHCVLLYHPPLGEVARERLSTLRETEDGFLIAEKDLELRGAGDVLGTKQSGLPAFRFADISIHGDLMAMAQDEARLIMERDPTLTGARSQALRTLLYLFRRDEAISYLRSG